MPKCESARVPEQYAVALHYGAMAKRINRREFVLTGTAAGLIAGARPASSAQAPAVVTPRRTVVVASANGNTHKNGGPVTSVQKAFTMMEEGSDVLDALIAGVNIVELDPADTSVGYGGLPNAEGVVQLDASVMHGPRRRGRPRARGGRGGAPARGGPQVV